MLKAKGKILLTLLLTIIFGVMLVTMVSALEGERVTIQFYNDSGNYVDKTINTNGIIEGEISILGGETVKLPNKDVAAGKSFNWYTKDGRAWEGGATVTFYEDAVLFPIIATDVATYDELNALVKNGGCTVRLLNDLKITKKLEFAGGGTGYESTFLLNGKKITIDQSVDVAWGGHRHGSHFYGVGTIEYKGTGTFIELRGHGTGGDHCKLFVGSNILIDAPNAILAKDGDQGFNTGYPRITIHGIVNCATVLDMQHPSDRKPEIHIYDGAEFNFSGPLIKHTQPGNNIHIYVHGGTITSTSRDFFADSTAEYEITGGVFKLATTADQESLQQSISGATNKIIDITDSNGTAYKAVVPLTVGCAHNFEIHSTYAANCYSCKKDNIICTDCDVQFQISIGSKTDHNYQEERIGHKDPTKTVPGWDKFLCPDCASTNLVYLYYDPANDQVQVTVNTGSGETTVYAKIKEVFLLDQNHVIKGVQAFGDYELSQIVGIYIPLGMNKVEILTSSSNAYVKTITFGSSSVVEVTSLKGLTKLENIVIESVGELVFARSCAPTTLKSIKSDISGASVEFKESSFTGLSSLTEMTFSTNSKYIFGKQSFKDTGVKSLDFVDGCSVTFSGEQAFYGSKVEYLYVGKGITALPNKPFDCAYYLQTIILMDVTSLSEYGFCRMNMGASVPVIYHHAKALSLGGNNVFYESHGIIIYTKAELTQGFNGCKSTTKGGVSYPAYTIHYGITHSYDRIEKEPTCTEEGSVKFIVSDCPCGENEGASYKVFKGALTNSTSYTIEDFTDKVKEKLPHNTPSLGAIKYTDGFTRRGYYTRECSMCHQMIDDAEAKCPALLISYGYSVSETDGVGSISVKYIVNEEALKQYEQANGVTLEYGTVVASKKALNGETPLDASGKARAGALKLQTSKYGYTSNSIKLTNIGDANKKTSYVMSLYIKDGSTILYVQDTETVENPSGVTYKEIKDLADYYESLSMTTVSSKET